MPNTTISQYMSLPVPVPTVDPGPQYATDLNTCLTTIDQHDHTTGKGTPVPTTGININADLPFNNFNLTTIRTARFQVQGIPSSAATDVGCIYVSGVDLYYNDVNGNQIRLTQNAGVITSPGNITGLVSPASVTYFPGTQTFQFISSTGIAANLDAGSVTIRSLVSGSSGLTLAVPNAITNYTLMASSALPSSLSYLQASSAGQLGYWPAPIIKDSNYTMGLNDDSLFLTTGSSALLVPIPSAIGIQGKEVLVRKSDNNLVGSISLLSVLGQTIDTRPSSSMILAGPGAYAKLKSDGTNWQSVSTREPIIARYCSQNNAQSFPASSSLVVNFETKTYDSHNAVTTGVGWHFTAPRTDYYQISSFILMSGMNAQKQINLQTNINGTFVNYQDLIFTQLINDTPNLHGNDIIALNRNDSLYLDILQTDSVSRGINSSSGAVYVNIRSL